MEEKKYKIGYVPGVFDLFHIGHLNLLERAKAQSEYLIAGVLTDELTEYFKSKKPYIPFEERKRIVASIKWVDEVVGVDFSNTVKMDAWKLYHYNAYFSGNDHVKEWERERKELQAVGAEIVFLPYTQSISSTSIKNQIKKSQNRKRLYLFGAGRIGQRVLKETVEGELSNKYEIVGFLDNAPEKHLSRIEGIPVFRPEDLLTLEVGTDYQIRITMKEQQEAEKKLQELGLEQKIIQEQRIRT